MAQDLNTLLQTLKDLTQAAREPGRLSPEQLDAEVRKITRSLQETLATLNTQFQQGTSPETAYMVEVFQQQIHAVLEQSGLAVEKPDETEETEGLSEDVERLKRGSGIRT
jgi:hypothetical protein